MQVSDTFRAMKTTLHAIHRRAAAEFRDNHGWEIPESFGHPEEEYPALKEAAGLVDLSFRGKLAATGEDRARFLHGMVSNEVEHLQPGQGCYCFILNAQGRILADLNLLVQPERVLLDCEPFLTAKIRETLDRYIIMDQVELEDLSARLGTLGVEGPRSDEVVRAALGATPPGEPLAHAGWGGDADSLLVRTNLSGEGLWIIAPMERIPEIWERLLEAARPLGGRAVGHAALEVARIEAGVPLYGADIEEAHIPQETGLLRAISFTKGCYIGQEIVERVRSRGHVNRQLVGLVATGAESLRAGMKVVAGGSEIGHVTSATHSPALGRHIALAYVRREFAEPGKQVTVEDVPAEVSALPFPRV